MKRYSALYLRPYDDRQSRRKLEDALHNFVGSRFRILQLADHKSNIISQRGIVARFVISHAIAVFLVGTLQLFQLIPKEASWVDFPLGMIVWGVAEFGYRKLTWGIENKSSMETLEELRAETHRVRSWIRSRDSLLKSVTTFTPSLSIWTDAIRELTPLVDVILLDVSRPGKGLAWELAYCLAKHPDRLLVVGREAEISIWLRNSASVNDHSVRMKELLVGRQILVYDRSPKTFPQALLAALLEIAGKNNVD